MSTQGGTSNTLSPKQAMVLNYMRGNGMVLSVEGQRQLVARGSFTNRGLSQVVNTLRRRGLVVGTPRYEYGLTPAGLRVSEGWSR